MKSKTITKTERVLIHQDDTLLNNFISRAERLFPEIKKLQSAYEDLEMPGVFDDQIYKRLISEPWELEKAYKNHLQEILDAAGVHNTLIRANLLNGTESALNSLKSALTELVQKSKGCLPSESDFPLNAILILNGEPMLTEESRELILESQCRIYLNNDVEKMVYDRLQALKDAYNELLESFDTIGFRLYFQGMESLNVYIAERPDKSIEIKPEAIQIISEYAALKQLAE
jgi:hypothetical protein